MKTESKTFWAGTGPGGSSRVDLNEELAGVSGEREAVQKRNLGVVEHTGACKLRTEGKVAEVSVWHD